MLRSIFFRLDTTISSQSRIPESLSGSAWSKNSSTFSIVFDVEIVGPPLSGWPSFMQPIEANVIAYRFDGPAFLKRVETICNTCEAHLGHVFPDGPEPGGLRYCM